MTVAIAWERYVAVHYPLGTYTTQIFTASYIQTYCRRGFFAVCLLCVTS